MIIDGVPPDIMALHEQVTLAIDIMFVSSISFLVTISRDMKFGTVERLPNRQIPILLTCLKKVLQVYTVREFHVTTILVDPKFQTLISDFPGHQLNCYGADENVPEIERYIRTVKDRVRSSSNMLPYTLIPRLVPAHLVKNAVFWLNNFPTLDGVSNVMSPRYLLTGRNSLYDRHVRLEFGTYVQTHEQDDFVPTHSRDLTGISLTCSSGRLSISALNFLNKLPCIGLVRKSASISPVGQYSTRI